MMRFLLLIIIPLLIPFGLYYLHARRHRKKTRETDGGHEIPWYLEDPYYWVVLGAFIVIFVTLGVIGMTSESEKPGGIYHPPAYKDGKLVPGYTERP